MAAQTPWEKEAGNWVKWARTPGHDVFAYFAQSFFEEMMPAAAGRTLEIGCGEGRVSRELASRGHAVVGLDSSPTLVRFAREANASAAYLTAGGTSLPFRDGCFETVVAYNSLQTMQLITDMPDTVHDAARVLRRGGHFCICIAHPMTDVGRMTKPAEGGALVAIESYFHRAEVNERVSNNGLMMTFRGWTHTLEDYARALEDAGLLIECMREPMPSVDDVASRPGLAGWRRVPLFLFIRAIKVAR